MDRILSVDDARTILGDSLDRAARGFRRRFEIDYRALAALRIAVGLLVLADLAFRSRDLVAFYTDDGVLPREALFSTYGTVYSLHAVWGEAWVQGLLFVVAGAFALAMTVGYRTRVATVASWLLLGSLHLRNPMVVNSGDTLLRMLLFWGIFLPLDDRWAVGASRTDRERPAAFSIATVALLVQVVLMYATNAVHKTRSEAWMNGEAVVYIFTADQFTILLGNVIAEYHALLELFNSLWVALILAAPLLLVLTGVPRAALASVFVGMHLGMVLTLRIGLFPLIVVAGLLPFYPSVVWDGASSVVARIGLRDALRSRLGRLAHSVPAVTLPDLPTFVTRSNLPAPNRPAIAASRETFNRLRTGCLRVLPGVFFVLVLTANAAAVDYAEVPEPADRAADVVEQNWRMFAPTPTQTTRWFATEGVLEDDTRVDVLHESEVDLDRPPSVEDTYPTSRWRKYLSNVAFAGDERTSYLANYLCKRWNERHETDVVEITVYHVYEQVDPYDGTTSGDEIVLQECECGGEVVRSHE
jgi:hypothetical protein